MQKYLKVFLFTFASAFLLSPISHLLSPTPAQAWQGPGLPPPACDQGNPLTPGCNPPLNVSSAPQTKPGALTLNVGSFGFGLFTNNKIYADDFCFLTGQGTPDWGRCVTNSLTNNPPVIINNPQNCVITSLTTIECNGITLNVNQGGNGGIASLFAGTGITLDPDPITDTGTISADVPYILNSLGDCGDNKVLQGYDRIRHRPICVDKIQCTGSGCPTNTGITGSGTPDYLSKWLGGTSLGDSNVREDTDTAHGGLFVGSQSNHLAYGVQAIGSLLGLSGYGVGPGSTGVTGFGKAIGVHGSAIDTNGVGGQFEAPLNNKGIPQGLAIVSLGSTKIVDGTQSGATADAPKILATTDGRGTAVWKTKQELGLEGGEATPTPDESCPADTFDTGYSCVDKSVTSYAPGAANPSYGQYFGSRTGAALACSGKNMRIANMAELAYVCKVHGGIAPSSSPFFLSDGLSGATGCRIDVMGGGASDPNVGAVLCAVEKGTVNINAGGGGGGSNCSISGNTITCDGTTLTVNQSSSVPSGTLCGFYGPTSTGRVPRGEIFCNGRSVLSSCPTGYTTTYVPTGVGGTGNFSCVKD